jgi:hypothetical protein
VVENKKSNNSIRPRLQLDIFTELYTDIVFSPACYESQYWTLNDASIYWLKWQNTQALERYIANPPTKQEGKRTVTIKFKYPY